MGVEVGWKFHNLSITPPAEHNFEHNTLVSRVTPESILLYFSSIMRQTLFTIRLLYSQKLCTNNNLFSMN